MKDLTKGNYTRQILIFALPVMFGNILQLLYSLVDTRIVGDILGDVSLAAVGATNSLSTLIVGFLIGVSNGFSIRIARMFGAKNEEEMRHSEGNALLLGTIITLCSTFVAALFIMPLLRLLNTPEHIIAQSFSYIRIIIFGMMITFFYNIFACILRAIGDSFAPLIVLFISTILNIGLDYLFIAGLSMGVEGAAFATIMAQMVSVLLCYIYILKRYKILHLNRKHFKLKSAAVKDLLSSGLSMGFMSSLVSIGSVSLQRAINTFGINTIVAHTAARKITEIFMLPFDVFGVTMATFASQNLGAGEITRIKKGLFRVIEFSWMWTGLVILASYTISPGLAGLITGSTEPEVLNTAALYLRIDTLFYFVPALISILRNTMQGIGDRITPIISSLIELAGKILVVIFLAPVFQYMGIIMAEPIVWILMVIPLIIQMIRNPIWKYKGQKV